MLRLTLSFGDFDIHTAPGGAQALDDVSEHKVDAILVDYEMPVMDGRAFIREARARGIDAPIIVVSAWPQARHVEGADMFISKPFDPDEVLRIVTEMTRAAA